MLKSCKDEYSSWYDFYSYIILASMKLWTQHLAFYIFFAICHIYNIWCRASAIPTVILSSSSIGNHLRLTCNKIITRVTFLTAWFVLMVLVLTEIVPHIYFEQVVFWYLYHWVFLEFLKVLMADSNYHKLHKS